MAIDNGAADDPDLHVLALGLLALLLRAMDGDDITVESIAKVRKEGREALTGAMRNLVENAYVVKFKIHHADGKWRTEFSVDSVPFTRDDVAAMLSEIEDARAIRVEPEWLDPRSDAAVGQSAHRPTVSRRSVATRGNKANPQVGTTDGFPAVGSTGVGSSAAKKKKTRDQDSLSSASVLAAAPAATAQELGEKTIKPEQGQLPLLTAVPSRRSSDSAVAGVVAAWSAARSAAGYGPHRRANVLAEFEASAEALVSAGRDVEWLVAVADWMGRSQPAWVGLAEATTAQYLGAPMEPSVRRVAVPKAGDCQQHPGYREDSCSPCRRAQALGRAKADPAPIAQDTAALLASIRGTG